MLGHRVECSVGTSTTPRTVMPRRRSDDGELRERVRHVAELDVLGKDHLIELRDDGVLDVARSPDGIDRGRSFLTNRRG